MRPFDDPLVVDLRARIARLHEDREEVAEALRPAVDAEIDVLTSELVNRLRQLHEGGEDVITGADA